MKIKKILTKSNLISFACGAVFFSGIGYAATPATSIDVYFQPLKYFFNNVEKKPPGDQQGFIYKGSTYVPLRFLSESLGKQVNFDPNTYSIYVGDPPNKTYLEDMTALNTSGDPPISFVKNFVSNTGESYAHALVYSNDLHMDGQKEYFLNGSYKKFEAVLVPDQWWSKGLLQDNNIGSLKIVADGQTVYDSGAIAYNSAPVKVSVDLTGVQKVTLIYTSEYLGIADAGFIK